MGMTIGDAAYEAYEMDQQAEADYEFIRQHIREELPNDLKVAVIATHQRCAEELPGELDYARKALERGDADGRLITFLRAYRAIDSYATELGSSIVPALLEPFARYVTETKVRAILKDPFLLALRDRVLDDTFASDAISKGIRKFYAHHSVTRNEVFHALREPTVIEAEAVLRDATSIFEKADCMLNPRAAILIKPRVFVDHSA